MILLYILYALAGITVIIFVHEAGHFMAAKKVGIRVERFALGFDPPFRGKPLRFLSFRRGDTEYVIGMIPFGGYVKLAGEVLAESGGKKPADDELLAKSPGARALVFVAGSVMNILSGFVFFIIAFTIGVSFTGPKVGSVVPGGPAWEAGVEPGDTIVSVAGEEVSDFVEARIGIALAERGVPLVLRVSRPMPDGSPKTLSITVVPRWNEQGFNEIGLAPMLSDIAAMPDAGGALEKAGLREGDRIVGAQIDGQKLPPLPFTILANVVQTFHHTHASRPFRLQVERPGGPVWLDVTPTQEKPQATRPQLGVLEGRGNVVRSVRPGSPAGAVFHPGDRLVAAGGEAVGSADWLAALEMWKGKDGKLKLEITAGDGARRTETVERETLLRWLFLGDIDWRYHSLRVAALKEDSPLAAAGLREGDVITDVASKPCFDEAGLAEILASIETQQVSVGVRREAPGAAAENLHVTLAAARLEGLPEDTWRTMPPIASVVEHGPAARAGIGPGSVLLSLDTKDILSWNDLLKAISSAKQDASLAVCWRDAAGVERRGSVTLTPAPAGTIAFPLRVERVTVQEGPLAAVSLGARRTVLISKQVLLTLRGLLRRDVAAKNLAGPVGIIHQFTIVIERGTFSLLLYWLALISVNLGLLNLMPFPILDGGHLLFLAIEKIKGSPVDIRVQEWAINIAFFLILFLAVFVTFNDLKRMF